MLNSLGNFLASYRPVACKMCISTRARPIYTCTVSKVYACGRWKFYSEDGSRWASLIRGSSLCRSRKQACRVTAVGGGGSSLERIPLIIYHYVVIVRHMFSILRGSRRVGSPSHVYASHDPMLSRQGRKKNKVIAPRPPATLQNTWGSIFEKKDPILMRIRRETIFDWGTLSLSIYLSRLVTSRVCRSRFFIFLIRF